MFTGFPSENTPSIKVWDFSQFNSGATSFSLSDDCAPIQYFRIGYSSVEVDLYLPTSPPDGKVIKLVNHKYGSNNQKINIWYSDASTIGAVRYFALGSGQTVDLCFTKYVYGFGLSQGYQATGWLMLNQVGSSANNYYSFSAGDGPNASGPQSVALGGVNTAAASQSIVAGGSSNTVNSGSNNSGIFAGSSNSTNTQGNTVVLGGTSNTNTAASGAILAGGNNTINSTRSACIAGQYGTSRSINGFIVTPASNAPIASSAGVSQTGLLVLGRQTTDATVTTLASDTSAASTTNQLTLPNNSAYYVSGSCIANVTAGGGTKAWSFEAAIKRGANAASTAIVGAVIKNVVAADAGAATWDITLSADTTNGAFRVQVTGQAATTIRWVCRVNSTEVTY
jgi:hypothetical protein